MIAVKGKYDGKTVILEKMPVTHECEVIVTFIDHPDIVKPVDNSSLEYLFRDYVDDGIREPVIDFGEAAGNEKW